MTQGVTHLWLVVEEWLGKLDFPPTQSRLAERLGLARNAVSEWKLGRSTPTPENMRALAELMEPQMGPQIYIRLVEAMNQDAGYLPASAALRGRVTIEAEARVQRAARSGKGRQRKGPQVQPPD